MSNYIPKNGEFTVWKNDKYEIGGKQPYAKGKGTDLNGAPIEITFWIPKSEKMADRALNVTIKPDTFVKNQTPQTNTQEVIPGDLPF